MEKIDIAKRVNELNAASEAYYNSSKPIMSDIEFDNKLEELRKWEDETGIVLSNSPTQNVGAVVLDNIPKIIHKTPMLSLAKCHTVKEIEKFAKGHDLVASVKLDGISCRLIYEDGELIRAESRGNGIEGNDITEHVKQFLNVPLHINMEGTLVIDGEALIKLDDFAEINKNGEYKNSRNLAAGTLASFDTSVVKDRKMRWYAWEIVNETEETSFYLSLISAELLGFDVVPFFNVYDNDYNCIIKQILNVAKEENLPQDGVVFKFDNIEYGKSLGNTTHHFNNGIAWKAVNDAYETELIDIEFTMGKTGILTPVAIFKPVEIEGSVIEKASLHNLSVMKSIIGNPWVGQHLGVYKSNLIIPQIRWAEEDNDREKNYIPIPNNCPICGQPTKIVKENDSEVLICTNDNCKGKLLGKLSHAVSRNALNIDGLSEATIEKFINLGWLNSIKDIYHLSDHEKEMRTLEGFGSKSVQKLLDSIEKSRKTNLQQFLFSLSIPLLGQTASKDIAKECDDGNYDFGNFMKIMVSEGAKHFEKISGIGNTLIKSLNTYFSEHCSDIFELSKEFEFEQNKTISENNSNILKDKVFVVTGSLEHYKSRNDLKVKIESLGGKVTGSISSRTNYLINNDINSTSSKNQKAKSLNVPIISEEEFLQLIGE